MSHRLGMAAWLADTEREFILHLSRIRPAFAPCGIISYLTASATRKPKYGAAYKPKICAKAYIRHAKVGELTDGKDISRRNGR